MTNLPKHRLHNGAGGAAITVRVTPSSAQNQVVEIMSDGIIQVNLKVPEASGLVNEALVAFLAQTLQVPPSHMEIVAGASGQDKLITILDVDSSFIQERITKVVSGH